MVTDIKEIRSKLDKSIGQRELLQDQKVTLEREMNEALELHENAKKALAIIQIVAEQTQKKLEYQISNLVSSALASVFSDPYKFELRFVQRRNKTEADLIFSKNGNETDDIKFVAGGGAVDIANLGLTFSLQSISSTDPILLLDEPAKFLSIDLQEKASSMIQSISKELGIQIIMISHLPDMKDAADRVINVSSIKKANKDKIIITYHEKGVSV